MELTEKDKSLFNTLMIFGCIYGKNAKESFGDGIDYPRKRFCKLKQHNYINTSGKLVFLGTNGKEYLMNCGNVLKEISRKNEIRVRRAEIYKASKMIKGFQSFVPSWDIKNTEEVNANYKHSIMEY
ncbi:hypothetical protein [Clostridium algidicarnis]|uniref:hypothetical protein n=1 Tax=Clostridium algidicarnis TaxID=37659 RepID=UPI001C0B0008|nr:hypothetical protein [Clostridium algidicarnis]MBU3193416.1 hypothetical protein [Clostridium algidicarnis]